ncbi:MAG: DUF1232 domain-containing protein [Desulfobacter sp.]|nr:DUF1232 domain-containing protein [Desulfobacter sp.]WDP86178.1 MAG: DUF1232 domain-containing protein [Desulfobacter sp.]
MNPRLKIILILFGLAYLISPFDLIPDLLVPWVGWIDDSLVLWSVYYLIRYGELPWFLFKKKAGTPFSGRPQGNKASGRPKPNQAESDQAESGSKTQSRARPKNRPKSKANPKEQGQDPHKILGVPKTAAWSEIQEAYKIKIKQYHPDKLSHLGDEFSALANEKFLEIQAA